MGDGAACCSDGGVRSGDCTEGVASPPPCPMAGADGDPLLLMPPPCSWRDGDCGGVKVAVAANTSATLLGEAAASVSRASRLETGVGVDCWAAADSGSACASWVMPAGCLAAVLLPSVVGVLTKG